MGDDARRPLDGVDLRHQCGVDQPGGAIQPIVTPARVLFPQHVTDGVVLAHEEAVEQAEAEPEVPGHPRNVESCLDGGGRQAVRVDEQLPVLAGAQPVRDTPGVAIDLGAVPPVRVLVHPGRRGPVRFLPRRVGDGAGHPHRALGPVVVGRQLDLVAGVPGRLGVAEPVVHLELQPGRGKEVQRLRRQERGSGQQFAADRAGVRGYQP